MKISVCVPTLNAAETASPFLDALKVQSLANFERWVIDSGSDDNTVEIFQSEGFQVHEISHEEFNHGGTRQLAVELCPDADIIIFLTQDAFLADKKSLDEIVRHFSDDSVGIAYGRQLPRPKAGYIEAHARLFNYPPEGKVKTFDDRHELGIKTAFNSNSFAAYRRSALIEVGGFPANVILSEDTYVAAKMLMLGWKVVYAAEAKVIHSHNYSFFQEFRRYFDIGVFHGREKWIRDAFGQAEGEGLQYIISELSFLWPQRCYLYPSVMLRTFLKLAGYKLGQKEYRLPVRLKTYLSMNSRYWLKV